jgi:ubiquitin carboxyl-terminal hydrolase 4/11/15
MKYPTFIIHELADSSCTSLHTDPWYCSKCQKHQQATKKFDLWRAPPVLVVHLKRFSYKSNRSYRQKIEEFIDYPIEGMENCCCFVVVLSMLFSLNVGLDLSRYVKGPYDKAPIYDLYAVSMHFGGLGGGHYTA